MSKFRRFLKSISSRFWLMNNPYSREWNNQLNALLDSCVFEGGRPPYTANLGGVEIWIANYPYAAFSPYNPHLDVRPSRMTILRAHEHYLRDVLATRYTEDSVRRIIESAHKENSDAKS